MDSAGCIIDNSVIYLCFHSYSKQLSLSELNIVWTRSTSLSCVGWKWPAVILLFGPGNDLGMPSGDLVCLEGPTGRSWG